MKLTKVHKQAFVKAVMQDLPQVEYREQAYKLMQDFVTSRMPKEVRATYDNKDTRHWLQPQSRYIDAVGYIGYVGMSINEDSMKSPERDILVAELKQIEKLACAQREQLKAVEEKINAVIAGCGTRKVALARLPEFEKYLPTELEGATAGVPMITDLVVSLTSLGWPKDSPLNAKLAA